MCKELALPDKTLYLCPRIVLGHAEGQDGVRDSPVGHLMVDGQHVPAPVAAGLVGGGRVDHHLCAAALALERDDVIGICGPVLRARAHPDPLERGDILLGLQQLGLELMPTEATA